MSVEVVWLNPVTQNYTPATAGDCRADPRLGGIVAAGHTATAVVNAVNDTTYSWSDYAAPTHRPMLRQRQSPRGNPTRLSQVPSLRQRQTFT